jgi:ClpP class serine protease
MPNPSETGSALDVSSPLMMAFAPTGQLLALDPKAFGAEFATLRGELAIERMGSAAVVRISGPLILDPDGWFVSYGQVIEAMRAALASDAEVAVMWLSSPGGVVVGAADTARALRQLATVAGKPLIAYTQDKANSAAYVLASAADEIWASEAAELGSVGVIYPHTEFSKAQLAMGETWTLITSGARKADGNPAIPLSEAAREAIQYKTDLSARQLAQAVAEGRPDLDTASILALEAATFLGPDAVAQKLADRIGTIEELTGVAGGAILRASTAEDQPPEDRDMPGSKASTPAPLAGDDSVREALRKAAEGDGDEAAKAKRALKAYDGEEDDKSEEEGKGKAESSEGEEKPEGEGATCSPERSGEDSEDEKPKASTDTAVALALASVSATARAEKAERELALERASKLPPEIREALADAPLTTINRVAAAFKVPEAPTPKVPLTSQVPDVKPTPTKGAGGSVGGRPINSLSARMGLVGTKRGHVRDDLSLTLGATLDDNGERIS